MERVRSSIANAWRQESHSPQARDIRDQRDRSDAIGGTLRAFTGPGDERDAAGLGEAPEVVSGRSRDPCRYGPGTLGMRVRGPLARGSRNPCVPAPVVKDYIHLGRGRSGAEPQQCRRFGPLCPFCPFDCHRTFACRQAKTKEPAVSCEPLVLFSLNLSLSEA